MTKVLDPVVRMRQNKRILIKNGPSGTESRNTDKI